MTTHFTTEKFLMRINKEQRITKTRKYEIAKKNPNL